MVLTPTRCAWAVVALAAVWAVAGARPHAGSANDGSRLAAIESLVERGTFAIDGSPFSGMEDKLRIAGRYYSDKPPLVSLLMAGAYRGGMALGLPAPSQRPDVFCLALTVAFSGGAFLVSLLCLFRVGRVAGLDGWPLTAWLASFAFATVAAAYTRHVNSHVLHLATLAGICLLAVEGGGWKRLLLLGTLAGFGFNLDLGSGPLLVLACLALAALQPRPFLSVTLVGLAAAPWVAAGLGLNLAIGGVLKPMNMVPEYLAWPGSPWTEGNLTGFSRHTPLGFARYAASLLVGKLGFLPYNLPLWLVPLALRRGPLRAETGVLLGWCAATWLLYAALSNNHSGNCASIRWFVPFLAPAYLLLALHLRASPRSLTPLLSLSAVGAALSAVVWWRGPWTRLRPLEVLGFAASAVLALLVTRRRPEPAAPAARLPEPLPMRRAA